MINVDWVNRHGVTVFTDEFATLEGAQAAMDKGYRQWATGRSWNYPRRIDGKPVPIPEWAWDLHDSRQPYERLSW